jgi:hypothetical protein
MFAIGATVVTIAIVTAMIHFGDQTIAAFIAAVASVVNAVILVRVRGAQRHIHDDIMDVKGDTDRRESQIEELRSLYIERNRQIVRFERLADRFEVLVPYSRTGGRRVYDPAETAEGEDEK